MSQEIIYTSAPQGLRPGSFGFCTVATTPGMTSTLAERLEAISGYRHVYSPGDVKEHLNPVVYSHLIFRVAGKPQHILSRVANAGFDYSQRTNKLAHHVVLDANELVAAGPAWVLDQPGFSETTWSGSPRLLSKGRACPRGESELRVCTAWQKATGDAGWAGVLAQQTLRGGKTAYLIFPEGMDVLPLLQEALALLPAARRWDVTFSTFFTRLPQGVDCAWRCVLANSTEAIAAASKQEGLIIELGRTLGPAPDNELVLAARTGKSNTPQTKVAAKPAPAPTAPPSYADDDDFLLEIAESAEDADLKLTPPEFKGKGKGLAKPLNRAGGPPKLPVKASRGKRVAIIAGLIAFTVVLVTGVGAFVFKDKLIASIFSAEPVNEAKPDNKVEPEAKPDVAKPAEPASEAEAEKSKGSDKNAPPKRNGKGDVEKKDEETRPNEGPATREKKPENAGPDVGATPLDEQIDKEEGSAKAEPDLPHASGVDSDVGLPQSPDQRSKEALGAGSDSASMATKPGPHVTEVAGKWPVKPVLSADPAMNTGLPNNKGKAQFLLAGSVLSLDLVGMSGRKVRLTRQDKSDVWRLIHEDSIGTKRDVLRLTTGGRTLAMEWKVANTKQMADELRHLSACSLVATLADGEKQLLPFSSQSVRGLRYGLTDDSKTDSFYLPASILSELHFVGIHFDRGNSDWNLDPAPLTNPTSHKCTFTLKSNEYVQSRLEIKPVTSSESEYCIHWDIYFGGQRVTKKQCERFAEISALADDEDKSSEKIATLVAEIVERSKVQNPPAEFVMETTAKTNELRELRNGMESINASYSNLGVNSPTAHFIRDKWPGMLTCYVARRVNYEGSDSKQDIDIPLVRIGGDPQP